jgi:hypothetical protein
MCTVFFSREKIAVNDLPKSPQTAVLIACTVLIYQRIEMKKLLEKRAFQFLIKRQVLRNQDYMYYCV